MTYTPPYISVRFASNEDEAEAQAEQFRELDPFPDIPPALLSSEHVSDYVRVTGMLYPFYPKPDRLKAASYEAFPGRKFIRWENEKKHVQEIKKGESYLLPADSITFMQIEPKIRLPNYIALRFNLRIKHVHRGLLLGTGPVVDPGFHGELLIPLHNLTSDPYEISADEGLIWIEFTKTSRGKDAGAGSQGEFHPIEPRKTDRDPEYYFEKASNNNPIRSSIPIGISEARDRASKAEISAREAEGAARSAKGYNTVLSTIGAVAIFAAVVALHSLFSSMTGNFMATTTLAGSVGKEAAVATVRAQEAVDQVEQLRVELNAAINQMEEMQNQIEEISDGLGKAQPESPNERPN